MTVHRRICSLYFLPQLSPRPINLTLQGLDNITAFLTRFHATFLILLHFPSGAGQRRAAGAIQVKFLDGGEVRFGLGV
jgi:hypothetical protein